MSFRDEGTNFSESHQIYNPFHYKHQRLKLFFYSRPPPPNHSQKRDKRKSMEDHHSSYTGQSFFFIFCFSS